MAIVQNPLIGKASGSAGGYVFQSYYGRNFIRRRPVGISTCYTSDQLIARDKFRRWVPGQHTNLDLLLLYCYGSRNYPKYKYSSLLHFLISLPISDSGLDIIFANIYNGHVIRDSRKITSSDEWQVPTYQDFFSFRDIYGADTGKYTRSTDPNYWYDIVDGQTNDSGFDARSSYYRNYQTGIFTDNKMSSRFWTRQQIDANRNYCAYINYNSQWFQLGTVHTFANLKTGNSIRLIKYGTSIPEGEFSTYTGNDNIIYPTVSIDGNEWTALSLVESKFRNGDTIPIINDNSVWSAATVPYSCYSNNLKSLSFSGGNPAMYNPANGFISFNPKNYPPIASFSSVDIGEDITYTFDINMSAYPNITPETFRLAFLIYFPDTNRIIFETEKTFTDISSFSITVPSEYYNDSLPFLGVGFYPIQHLLSPSRYPLYML